MKITPLALERVQYEASRIESLAEAISVAMYVDGDEGDLSSYTGAVSILREHMRALNESLKALEVLQ